MPTIWRILNWIDHLNRSRDVSIGINELAYIYDLMTFGDSRFLFEVKTGRFPLVLNSKHNNSALKGKYFFVKCNSIPDRNLLPHSWVKNGKLSYFYIDDPDINISYVV